VPFWQRDDCRGADFRVGIRTNAELDNYEAAAEPALNAAFRFGSAEHEFFRRLTKPMQSMHVMAITKTCGGTDLPGAALNFFAHPTKSLFLNARPHADWTSRAVSLHFGLD
jgi:hypothetical protein